MDSIIANPKLSIQRLLDAALVGLCEATHRAPGEALCWFVPGRIEILGKHTDYGGGRSLVCATSRGIAVAAMARPDAVLNIVDAGRRLETRFEIAADLDVATNDWTTFPRAVARRIARNFPGAVRGADIAIASDLPRAAGLSSSSALIVGFFSVLAAVNALEARPEYREHFVSGEDLAEYLGCCESGRTYRGLAGDRGVGTLGGSQDHTAILCSRAGELHQYRFVPVRQERAIVLGDEWTFAIAVSGVAADKTGEARDAYNRASRALSAILEAWQAATGRCDATLFAAATSTPDALTEMRRVLASSSGAAFDAASLLDRFDQFAAEAIEIVPAAGDALAQGDTERFGALVDRSQHNAERLLGNQVAETVALARSAREIGAAAASAFGAGFGGSVWALVRRAEADDFMERWSKAYGEAFPARAARAEFFATRPGPGLVRLANT